MIPNQQRIRQRRKEVIETALRARQFDQHELTFEASKFIAGLYEQIIRQREKHE